MKEPRPVGRGSLFRNRSTEIPTEGLRVINTVLTRIQQRLVVVFCREHLLGGDFTAIVHCDPFQDVMPLRDAVSRLIDETFMRPTELFVSSNAPDVSKTLVRGGPGMREFVSILALVLAAIVALGYSVVQSLYA